METTVQFFFYKKWKLLIVENLENVGQLPIINEVIDSQATIPLSTQESVNSLLEDIERANLENGKTVFSQTFSKEKNAEVILDTNYLSFKEAISFLETNNNKSFTFKLLPTQSNFIIGSNNSNDRGEVINL